MIWRPPRYTRTDTLVPDTRRFRSCTGSALAPSARISAATGTARSSTKSLTATPPALWRASASAIARPAPWPAPVTNAIWPPRSSGLSPIMSGSSLVAVACAARDRERELAVAANVHHIRVMATLEKKQKQGVGQEQQGFIDIRPAGRWVR